MGLSFSSKWNWGSYIVSTAKTPSKRIGTLICSMEFLSSEVALYLYKSTIQRYMTYCCYVRAGACYWDILDASGKWEEKVECKAAGLKLAASLETLAYGQNVAILTLI